MYHFSDKFGFSHKAIVPPTPNCRSSHQSLYIGCLCWRCYSHPIRERDMGVGYLGSKVDGHRDRDREERGELEEVPA